MTQEQQTMKDQTYCAVFTPEGLPMVTTISTVKDWSISTFCPPDSWHGYKEIGYTVSKIKITEIEE